MQAPAHFVIRLKAKIIDAFMIYMPILYVITYIFMGSKEAFLQSDLAPFVGVFSYGVIDALLSSLFAQTPGKKAYDIRVVNDDGTKLSFIKSLIRFYLFLFSCAIIMGILLPLIRKDKKALHDLLLRTKAVVT